MKKIIHIADSRGTANHGWLSSHHTFSFAEYYDRERMGFGVLRVINDDIVAPHRGFDAHSHRNMEIISVPLQGSLKHKDILGNEFVIKKGEVQAMSAGTGLTHSEFNNSSSEDVNFLQIWVLPRVVDTPPRYSQKEFPENERLNRFQLIVSPDGRKDSVSINQDAYFSLVKMEKEKTLIYEKYLQENGIYFFIIEGEVVVDQDTLSKRDGIAIENWDAIRLESQTASEVLVMEVPMNLTQTTSPGK